MESAETEKDTGQASVNILSRTFRVGHVEEAKHEQTLRGKRLCHEHNQPEELQAYETGCAKKKVRQELRDVNELE